MDPYLSELEDRVKRLEDLVTTQLKSIESVLARDSLMPKSIVGLCGLPILEISEDEDSVTLRLFNKNGEPCVALVADAEGGAAVISENVRGNALILRATDEAATVFCQNGEGKVSAALTNRNGSGQMVIAGRDGQPAVSLVSAGHGGAGAFHAADGTSRIVFMASNQGGEIRMGGDSGRQLMRVEVDGKSAYLRFASSSLERTVSIQLDESGDGLMATSSGGGDSSVTAFP